MSHQWVSCELKFFTGSSIHPVLVKKIKIGKIQEVKTAPTHLPNIMQYAQNITEQDPAAHISHLFPMSLWICMNLIEIVIKFAIFRALS